MGVDSDILDCIKSCKSSMLKPREISCLVDCIKLFLVNLIGFGQLDFRRNYHLYSWFSFDQLKREGKFAYIFLYASPIVFSTTIGLILNALLANGYLDTYATFFDRFIFYLFFYVLFDAVPMTTINGMPNNGKIIFDMLLHGKRTDPNLEDFIPSTSNIDEVYEEIKEDLEDKNNKH